MAERGGALCDQKASGIVCGPGGCLIHEVNCRLACRSSVPSRAMTAFSNRFIIRQNDWDNAQLRRTACLAGRSLGKLRSGSPIAYDMCLIRHGKL